MRFNILAFLGLALLAAAGQAAVYEAPDAEPSAKEVLLVEYLNRCRADPAGEAERITPGGMLAALVSEKKLTIPKNIDWVMFKKEMKELQPAPPLVINLQLLDAARKHSHYMILNTQAHVEEAGKDGFVAREPSERLIKAGYPWRSCGENIGRDNFLSLWCSHAGFVVDWGEGPGGMQPRRGHRVNIMNGKFREVGCGCLPHEEQLSITQEFGERNVPRLAGGVVYYDKTNRHFYDPDQGLGGVTISASDGSTTLTWKSGGYALALKSTAAVTLTASYKGKTYARSFEEGAQNIKFDISIAEPALLERAARLLAAVEQVKDPASAQYFRAVVDLYANAHGLTLVANQQEQFDELTKTIGPEVEKHQQAVLEAFRNLDVQTWLKILEEHRKPYRGTVLEAWFKDADSAARAKLAVANFEQQMPQDQKLSKGTALAAQLDGLAKVLQTEVFKEAVAAMTTAVKNLSQGVAP